MITNIKSRILITMFLSLALMITGCAGVTTDPNMTESSQATTEETTSIVTNEAVQETENKPVVVAGTVSVTRILHDLGVDIVAIPQTEKALPEKVKSLPAIGLPMNPNIELVMSYAPDFFITDASLEASLSDPLKAQNINTVFLKTSGYNDIIDSILHLGEIFKKQNAATKMVNHITELEEQAVQLSEGKESISVAIIFGTPESFMLSTGSSYVGSLVSKLGGTNITDGMEGARAPYIAFSLETLAEMNPDVILRMTHVNPEQSKIMFDEAFSGNAFYSGLKAVKEGKVIDLDSNYFGVTATVDCGEAILMMARHLYGE